MHIHKINRIVITAYLIITAINVASFVQFGHMRANAQQAVERQSKATIEAERMIAGSKSLTNSVRAFAAMGDPKHEKAYWDEVKVIRSRDLAEAALRDMGLTDGEIDLIERAKGNSDKLIELEDQAFKVGAQGNRAKAVELVFGEEYTKALASIYSPVDQFRQRLDKRMLAEITAVEHQLQYWWMASLTLAAINALLVIFILGFLYKRRVVEPLAQLNIDVQAMLEGRQTGEQNAVSYAGAATEIQTLSDSFAILRDTHRKAADTQWIKTHAAEIAGALQGAENMRALAQAVVSKISPLIGAGHAGFYVADAEHRFQLLGSYGYRERKHLNNTFAIGEGLVGQCAMEKVPIMLTAPGDYIRINSGLGEGPPVCISVMPVVMGGRVLGVLEMASFQAFTEREHALMDALLPVLATSLEILDRNLKTRELLAATQEQAERMEKQAAQMEEQQVEMEAQQAELLETETWFRSIIESAPDGMLVTDAAGRILLSNPKVEKIFGYGPGELVGSSVDQLVPDSVRAGHPAKRAAFMTEGRNRPMGTGSQLCGRGKNGEEVAIHVTLALLPPRGNRGKCVSVSVRKINN